MGGVLEDICGMVVHGLGALFGYWGSIIDDTT